MSTYSCAIAEEIGRRYHLAPEQVWPDTLRNLAVNWHPDGRDLSKNLLRDADRLDKFLTRQRGPKP